MNTILSRPLPAPVFLVPAALPPAGDASPRGAAAPPAVPSCASFSASFPATSPAAAQFEAMRAGLQPHGGFIGCDEAVQRLRGVDEQPLSTLARRIVSRQVLAVSWRRALLLPAFQFDPVDLSVRPACARVAGELADVFDDWELALWFATPNLWLRHESPVARLHRDEAAVLAAARADRFVARG